MAEDSLNHSVTDLKEMDAISLRNRLLNILDDTHSLLKALSLAALNVVDEPALDNDDVAIITAMAIRKVKEGIRILVQLIAAITVTTEI